MDTFRIRVVRAIRAGWGIFGSGLIAAIATLLLGGRRDLSLALGLVALAITIAFALNLTLLVILWRREARKHNSAVEPIAAVDAPTYEQPAGT